MADTHLDELVTYPTLVISQVVSSQIVMDLLADKNGATIEDMEDANGDWRYFFDFEYIPGTTQEVLNAVCVDTDIVAVKSSAQKDLELYVSVLCSRAILRLDHQLFPGMQGNRMDNLVRYIDLALRGDRDFGIGPLTLKTVRTTSSGNSAFAKKTITYLIPNFNVRRDV